MAFRTPPCVSGSGGPLALLGAASAQTETRDPGPVGPTFLFLAEHFVGCLPRGVRDWVSRRLSE
jgi:hypothetical protein